jgi:hypothetical protein
MKLTTLGAAPNPSVKGTSRKRAALTSNVRRQSTRMRIFSTLAAATALLLCSCGAPVNANPNDFYAPKLLLDEERMTFVVPVEIDARDGKKSFVKLFELYGFSGNGPSIEQVIRHNVPGIGGSFDSEGDAFVLLASNKADFEDARAKLKCIENVECLSSWLARAQSLLFKE